MIVETNVGAFLFPVILQSFHEHPCLFLSLTARRQVFASCGVDQHLRIWDARTQRQALSLKAHNSDVNVISWNTCAHLSSFRL